MTTFSSIHSVNRAMREHLDEAVTLTRKNAKRQIHSAVFPLNALYVLRVNQQHVDRETGGFIYLRTTPTRKATSIPKAVIQTHVGTIDEVELINLMNLEIDWHTHVDYSDGRKLSPPSPADYISCLLCHDFFGAQISLVFTKEGLYFMWPTVELVKRYMREPDSVADEFQQFEEGLLDAFFNDKAFQSGDLSQYFELVHNFGFRVFLISWADIDDVARNHMEGLTFSYLSSRKPVD
jgi:hypothetical protein